MELSDVRHGLQQFFADCPDAVAARFCMLLAEPAEALIARAQLTLSKPYGRNHILSIDGGFGISFACLGPGHATSLHYHRKRREFFYVHAGVLQFTSGDAVRCIPAGGTGHSIPPVPHSLRNAGENELRVLEMFSPPVLADKVRLSDRYDRTLGPVSLYQ
ncbi:MAG TPA: cupin domain-containing protein [Thermoanaerobaculia bacterium]|nr:cupin domain-containing protein [Thermoanaerobaculia bacterium]